MLSRSEAIHSSLDKISYTWDWLSQLLYILRSCDGKGKMENEGSLSISYYDFLLYMGFARIIDRSLTLGIIYMLMLH